MTPDAYLTVEEVAERLGRTTATVVNWIRGGRLRGIDVSAKPGMMRQTFIVHAEDLAAFELAGPPPKRYRKPPARDVVEFIK